MEHTLGSYLPQDRLRAIASGSTISTRVSGAALFADISGFTPLTERLTQQLGARRGIEELSLKINQVYNGLINAVDNCNGSVISFAGDAITCWFDNDDENATARAVSCGLAMQNVMAVFDDLALKVVISSGPARRFVVGNPSIQQIDTLAGETIARLAIGEHLASKGEILLDEPTVSVLGAAVEMLEQRISETGEQFAILRTFTVPVSPSRLNSRSELADDVLRTWLFPAVYKREISGFGTFLTELRPTVALFLRFGGIDYDNDDEAGEKLNALVSKAQEIINGFDGALLQVTIGDKGSYFYGAFGAPVAHEDDPERALQAALELQRLPQLLLFLRSVQIGVSSGTTRAGAYGGYTRRTYGVLGDDVNLAARLMMNAIPGEILVSSSVQNSSANVFVFEPRLPLQVKGKRELVTVFTLAGLRRQRAIRLEEPVYLVPMIGRKTELGLIEDKLKLALQSSGQLIGITAEAGLGKSRLVSEVIRLARTLGFTGYGGVSESSGTRTPYLVWKGVWQALFNLDSAMGIEEEQRQVEAVVHAYAPHRVDALPLLSPLIDIPIEDNDFTRSLSPRERRNILTVTLEDCLRSAAGTPLLLVLEDIHWIDGLSLDLLNSLAATCTTLPVVFVMAYRPLEIDDHRMQNIEVLPHFTRIPLDKLDQNDSEQLIQAKLAQLFPQAVEALPSTLTSAIQERADGNPFYLEELLNYLHDRNINLYDPNVLKTIELPFSLHTLILSRIDQLSEEQKITLKSASIIGRLFKAAWLFGYYPLLGNLEQVKDELDALSKLELTPLDTPEPELSYLFKHIVTREVIYESLPHETRTQLHERLAQYIESQGADSYLDLLAYHYGLTENKHKQREYFSKAGSAARATFANDAALDYYARLLPLLDDPNEIADVHTECGQVLELTGRWDNAEKEFQNALKLRDGQSNDQVAHIQFLLGRLANSQSNYVAALEWQEKARSLYSRQNNHNGLAQVLLETGNINISQGNLPVARKQFEESLTLGRQINDQLIMGRCLIELGKVAYLQGDLNLSQSLMTEGLTIMRALGHKQGQAISLNVLGVIAGDLGDRAAQRTYLQESLVITQQTGDRMGTAFISLNLGSMASSQGEFEIAHQQISTSLSIFQSMGERATYAEGLLYLGNVELLQGNFSAARQRSKEALTLLRELGNNIIYLPILVQLEWITALLEGDLPAAQIALKEGLILAREMDNVVLAAQTIIAEGHLALELGDLGAAEQYYRIALHDMRSNPVGAAIIPMALLGMICILIGLEEYEPAAHLAAFSDVLYKKQTYQWTPLDKKLYDRSIIAIRESMKDEDFDTAWSAGKLLSLDEAVGIAL